MGVKRGKAQEEKKEKDLTQRRRGGDAEGAERKN
jgi:hypothetical protein